MYWLMMDQFSRILYTYIHTIYIIIYILYTYIHIYILHIYIFTYIHSILYIHSIYILYIYIHIIIYILVGCNIMELASRLHLLCFSPFQWLTRNFNMIHFAEFQSTLSEVSMRDEGQRRLQARKGSRRSPRLHINCNRMSKTVSR